MGFEVVTVDPHDEQAFRRCYETFARAAVVGRTDPTLWTYEEAYASLVTANSSARQEMYVALDGGEPVGAGDLTLPMLENTGLLGFDFAVLEDQRRRGVGAALFDHVVGRARAEGRTTLATELSVTAGTEHTAPAKSFFSKRGLTLRNTEFRRQLRVPVPPDRLADLADKAAAKASGYELLSWVDACPDRYADQYARLKGLLATEAPTGELEIDAEMWTVERLRESERRSTAQGRTSYTTVAVAPDGSLAGHTQLMVPGHEPGRAYQSDTLVLDVHRGHRLGLALKVANLRRMQSAHPDVGRIETWNAEQNGPMVAVNEELGYRIAEVCQEWQGPRSE